MIVINLPKYSSGSDLPSPRCGDAMRGFTFSSTFPKLRHSEYESTVTYRSHISWKPVSSAITIRIRRIFGKKTSQNIPSRGKFTKTVHFDAAKHLKHMDKFKN